MPARSPNSCSLIAGGGGVYCGAWYCCGLIGCFVGSTIMSHVANTIEDMCGRIDVGTQTTCSVTDGVLAGVHCDGSCKHDAETQWGDEGESCAKTSVSTVSCACKSEVAVTLTDTKWPAMAVTEDPCTVVKFNDDGTETTLNTAQDGSPLGRRLTGRPLRGLAASNTSLPVLGAEGRRLALGAEFYVTNVWCVFVPTQTDTKDELWVGWTKVTAFKECTDARDTANGISAALLASGIGSVLCFLCCCGTGAFLIVSELRQRSLQPAFSPSPQYGSQPGQPNGQPYVQPAVQPVPGETPGAVEQPYTQDAK